jgi:predicted RNase H-like nuclease (RuvC/YqgF family)
MTDRIIKTEDSRLVTVGTLKKILKEERVITSRDLKDALRAERAITLQEFAKVEKKREESMTAIAQTLNRMQEAIFELQKLVGFLVQEVTVIRSENREFRESLAYLDRSCLSNEQKIEYLDSRILKLETTK